jgi:hypothetical protein
VAVDERLTRWVNLVLGPAIRLVTQDETSMDCTSDPHLGPAGVSDFFLNTCERRGPLEASPFLGAAKPRIGLAEIERRSCLTGKPTNTLSVTRRLVAGRETVELLADKNPFPGDCVAVTLNDHSRPRLHARKSGLG